MDEYEEFWNMVDYLAEDEDDAAFWDVVNEGSRLLVENDTIKDKCIRNARWN